MPLNPISGRTYGGINAISLLMAGSQYLDARWLTFGQTRWLGGQIRRGETGAVIQYWKFREQRTLLDETGMPLGDAQGEPVKLTTKLERPRLFAAVVFNADQADGLPPAPPLRALGIRTPGAGTSLKARRSPPSNAGGGK